MVEGWMACGVEYVLDQFLKVKNKNNRDNGRTEKGVVNESKGKDGRSTDIRRTTTEAYKKIKINKQWAKVHYRTEERIATSIRRG